MKKTLLIFAAIALFSIPDTWAQNTGKLIINPKLMGGLGSIPVTNFLNGYWVRRDEHSGTYIVPKLPPRKSNKPEEILITGMVPDYSKRWSIIITHNEAELQQKLLEYKNLKKQRKISNPRQVMYIKNIAVATEVKSFFGGAKVKDMPEEAGTFFLTVMPIELEKHGNLITFISHTPQKCADIVDVGEDFGEEINGMLLLEETVGEADSSLTYNLKVVKANLTDEKLRNQTYVVRKQ